MHICLISSEFLGFGIAGGFGFATRSLGRNLVARGHRVTVAMPRPVDRDEERACFDGIAVRTFPRGDILGAGQLFREIGADIHHSQHPSLTTHVAQRAMPGAGHVVTVRDPRNIRDWWLEFRYPSRSRIGVLRTMAFYDNPLTWMAVRRSDRVLVPAKCLAGTVRRRYLLARPPGFMPTPITMPGGDVRKSARPMVCYVGRLDRRKRPDRFLALAPGFPGVEFVVVGGAQDAAYERELMALHGGAGNVRMLGFVDQFSSGALHEVLAESWVMVNTAMREGLPNVFIEAAAHGCAIVSAHDPDGFASRFGRHCPDGDFGRALGELLESGRWRTLGQAGAAYARATNDAGIATQLHEAMYASLLEEKRLERRKA
jgi:glycosyltransferase involved in cell wall biosynthesis